MELYVCQSQMIFLIHSNKVISSVHKNIYSKKYFIAKYLKHKI